MRTSKDYLFRACYSKEVSYHHLCLAETQRQAEEWESFIVDVGLHPIGLQDLCLHSFKTEDRAQSQQQRHQWFNGWGSLHVWSKVLE